MTEPLRVLVIGPGAASASDALRFVAMIPALAGHGVELVNWTPPQPAPGSDAFDALEAAVGWADVLVLRRFYRTWHACVACRLRTLDTAEAVAHGTVAGHSVVLAPYFALRPLVGLLETEPGALGKRAIVFDTDDDVFAADLPPAAEDFLERDLVARILDLADLVTVSTPVLAQRLVQRTTAPVRVIRNAVDPAWYEAGSADGTADTPGFPRVVYHGAPIRWRDYELARPGVDAAAAEIGTLRRVWLGADAAQLAGSMDEARPWVGGVPEFATALVAARPDIGIAPLQDTPYNRARSELHWLEYALAGAPTIVSGLAGPNPYDVVRDGVDGLVAQTAADWARHISTLAASTDLRAELAAHARTRVLADYSVASRAPEWAGAYLWAAEHAGSGRSRHAADAR